MSILGLGFGFFVFFILFLLTCNGALFLTNPGRYENGFVAV